MFASSEERRGRALRGLGPAMGPLGREDIGRAVLGAALGLGLVALFLLPAGMGLRHGLYMVAPLGASAVLMFGVPNSPLAQPWSAVVGNMISALVAVAVVRLVAQPALAIGLAVGLAILAMCLLRALHPPGGAVALTAALEPEAMSELGFGFVLAPVGLGTAVLVVLAMVWARAVGRRYPLRQVPVHEAPQPKRLGLGAEELQEILREHHQTANLGPEDLGRLVAAAEQQAAGARLGTLTCGDIMSRDLVTVGPDTPLVRVADLFRRHGFTSLPVVDGEGLLLGVIFQIHLIRRGHEDALRLNRGFAAGLARLLDGARSAPVASEVMAVALPRAVPETPVGAILPHLADGATEAVPVLSKGRIVGIVTRSDLIVALSQRLAQPVAG